MPGALDGIANHCGHRPRAPLGGREHRNAGLLQLRACGRDPIAGRRQREHGGRAGRAEQLDRVDHVGLLEQVDGEQVDPVGAADGLEHRAEGLGGAARVDRVALEGDRREKLAQTVDRHLR